jgi:hypothetical protein
MQVTTTLQTKAPPGEAARQITPGRKRAVLYLRVSSKGQLTDYDKDGLSIPAQKEIAPTPPSAASRPRAASPTCQGSTPSRRLTTSPATRPRVQVRPDLPARRHEEPRLISRWPGF